MALLTEFRLKCVGTDNRNSVGMQTVTISNAEVGSFDVVYSANSRGMILPDHMTSGTALWTIVFPDGSLGQCGETRPATWFTM